MPEICISCKKSKIEDHSDAELLECSLEIIQNVKSLNSNRDDDD